MDSVWVFMGERARHAAGVFTSKDEGLAWVRKHRLTGILTRYPVGDGCYDIAIREGLFHPSKPHHGSPDHIAGFSPGWTEHIHLVDGEDA